MGVLSVLGKIGGAIAAPFTGGASLIPSIISGVSGIAGSAAKGNAQGQAQQATIQQNQDALALKRQEQIHQQILDAIAAQKSQYADATHQALGGGLLQGLQDVSFDGLPAGVSVPHISGGLRPSSILGATGIGKSMQERGLSAMSNPALSSMRMYQDTAMPDLTSLPKQGAMSKILGAIGTFGSLAGGAMTGAQKGWMPDGAAPIVGAPTPDIAGMPTGTPDWTFGGAQPQNDWAAQFGVPPVPGWKGFK